MIDTGHLVYAGVLLLFLAGAVIVALAALLFLSTGFLTAAAARIIRRGRLGTGPARRSRRGATLDVPLPMEEALRQVAAGRAAPVGDRDRKAPRTAATHVKAAAAGVARVDGSGRREQPNPTPHAKRRDRLRRQIFTRPCPSPAGRPSAERWP